jgi:trehalose-6-phosphate synthase
VPFPNPEILFTLSVRRRLVGGMLGADLIGFHTRRYRGHFTAAMRRLFGIDEGLSLPGLERRTRTRRLREKVFGHDVHALAREFRAALEAARPTHHASMHA